MEIKPQGNESKNSFLSPVIVTYIIVGIGGGGVVHDHFFIYIVMLLAVYNEWLLRVPPGVTLTFQSLADSLLTTRFNIKKFYMVLAWR